MRTFCLLASLCLAACATASAKPPVKAVTPQPPPLPEYVDFDDAKAALEAQAELQAAANALSVKQVAWQRMKNRLIEKYGTDPESGGGWDVTESGKLKVKRVPPPVAKPAPAPPKK